MTRTRIAVLLLAGLTWAAGVEAGSSASSKSVTATLLSDVSAVQPGQPFHLAVRLEMKPEWHTYWKNPGDSGLPTKILWTLPAGSSAGEILWPAPDRFVVAPLASYGYHDVVILATKVTPPADASGTFPIAAKVSWLECKDLCLPGKAQLDLSLPVGSATPSSDAPAIQEWLARVPGKSDGRVTARAENGELQVGFAPASDKAAIFPLAAGLIQHAADQKVESQGEAGTLRVPLDPNARIPERLTGVLVLGDRAFDVDVPLTSVGLNGGAAGAVKAPPAAPTDGKPRTVGLTSNVSTLPMALLFAFVGGLILNLMPCVLPVLSLKVLSFVKHAGEGRPWRHGLAFAGGVLLSFWILAGVLLALRAAGEKIGWGFQLQSPSFLVMLTGLFFLMGLNLFGVFEVGTSLTSVAGYAHRQSGLASSFWGGGLATVVATPCTAPFMGSALGFALSQPAWVAMTTFTALALGMAAPYVLLSMFPRLMRFVPKSGPWMNAFKQLMGFLLMATVVALLWLFGQHTGTNGMAALLGGLLLIGLGAWLYGQYGTEMSTFRVRLAALIAAAVLVISGLTLGLSRAQAADVPKTDGGTTEAHGMTWEAFSPARIAELRAAKRPVFVDFTAAWCLTCQVNERAVLGSAVVQQRFREAGVVTVKADWTHRDETITQALAAFGRQGVPLYVFYPPGSPEPVLLPEVLTEDVVLEALARF